MNRFPPWIWLLLTVAFAAAAGLAWIKSRPQPAPAPVELARLVVAKGFIGPATRLSPDQLRVEEWRPESVPKGASPRPEMLEGRVTAYAFTEGEPIVEKKLAPKGTSPGLTALLPPHKRAMTVKVDEASGVAGFVVPDNRVDVVVTVDKGDFSKNPMSKVVFQNLKVLGVGQRIEHRPGDKPQVVPTVTLEVTPEEGERLALASQEGRISLVLRSQDDARIVETRGAIASRMFGSLSRQEETRPPPPTRAPARRTVDVIRGLQREPIGF
jgi:pilus assembly protein CpaB